ncbi:MAG: hypothetical protein J6J19_07495, partial [Oscillospiraceae bacterium]|nr:hypothetical protein [Oscillospiraceae bacterium]
PEPAPVFDLYSYDAQGRELSHTKQRSDGTLLFRRETGYDADGNRFLMRIYDGSGKLVYGECLIYQEGLLSEKKLITTGQTLRQRTIYEYENGVLVGKSSYDMYSNLTQYIRYTADGKALYWELYEYNDAGQETRYYRYTAKRQLDYWHEYEYDAQGRETSHARYNADGSRRDWSEYTYDEQGHLLCQKQYDSAGSLNVQTDYTYNEDGSFSTWTFFYRYDGTMSKELSIYDKNGNRTHYAAYPSGGYLSHGSDSKYDENGNLIEHAEFGYGGLVTKWYEYEYDDQGRELRRYTHGLYERASSYENRYDEEGNCIERIYYDNEGNVTDRVQNPSPELSFRYIYRPDY